MSKEKLNLLAGIEIGTSKVAISLAVQESQQLDVIAIAQASHKGMHQGQIVDVSSVSQAIQKAKAEVEATSGQLLNMVYVSVADLTTETLFSKGIVSIRREITRKDIEAAMDVAKESAQIRSDREILHVFPKYYKVDGFKFDEAPIGHKGTSLELACVLITASKKNISIAKDCIQSHGLYIHEFVSPSYASAFAVTSANERDQGVAVVDMGNSITSIVAFLGNKAVYSSAIPLGGLNFTQDLAVGLRTPQAAAEQLKKNHGSALMDLVDENSVVQVESLRGGEATEVSQKFVCEILEARAEETLGLILKKLNDEDLLFQLKGGVVLTGGGSLLPGLPELAQYTFDIPLRRGLPKELAGIGSLNQGPGLSTCLGLLQYARKRHSFEPLELSIETLKSKWGQLKNLIDNIL